MVIIGCGGEKLEIGDSENAISGNYVTTYSMWTSTGEGVWNIDARMYSAQSPGTNASYYFARQGSWTNKVGDDGWYIGLQTNAAGPAGRIAIFSIWNALDAQSLDSAAECVTFGNEGAGLSCRLEYNWVAGRIYRLRVWRQNDGWWIATVFDEAANSERTIGRIRTRAGQGDLSRSITDFVEYYGGEFGSCADLPPSQMYFYAPSGNNGAFYFTAAGSSKGSGACGSWRYSSQSPYSSYHIIGQDGPYFIRSTLAERRCLDGAGGASLATTYMRDCGPANGNLLWFLRPDGEISVNVFPGYRCLDANTGQFGRETYMRDCNPANTNLQWTLRAMQNGIQLQSRTPGNRCLDANTGASGRPTYMRDCDGGANYNLLWTFEHQ